ncbi:MAG: mevalonate kinase [Candidatus Bathyarchaeota archaeon]|nr:mevalonate kinase [Candidatus Bathyarchaeota archaeon]
MKNLSRASAPAKAILFGEHFVVHGKPAIVMAINLRAYATAKPESGGKIIIESKSMRAFGSFTVDGAYQPILGGLEVWEKLLPIYVAARKIMSLADENNVGVRIEVESSIPIAAGLGSSAAVSVASAAAVGRLLELNISGDDIFRVALEAERTVHENPSGVDPAISTYGGLIIYHRGEGIRRLDAGVDLPLVVGDTCIKRVTGEMVLRVSEVRKRYPDVIDRIMDSGEAIVKMGAKALQSGDLKAIGDLMNINHALLCALGVSNEMIDRLVYAARNAGALGAKLTGAGGGGCIIALPPPGKDNRIVEAIEGAGGRAFTTCMSREGVRIEEQ